VQGTAELSAPGIKIKARALEVTAEAGTALAKALTPVVEQKALPQKAKK
jgi:hypothetical protein